MRINRQLTSIIGTSLMISVFPTATFASTNLIAQTNASSGAAINRQQVQNTAASLRITNLKGRADQEIARRVISLSNLVAKIGSLKKLTADQKSSFTTQVQTEITNLNNLKTKIDADTDLASLKTDVQSIVTSYRVYALFIPQIHILIAADTITQVQDNLANLVSKIQSRITQMQQNGKDVSSLQTALSDLNAKLTDSKTQTQNAINTVVNLKPDGYPANKTALMSARQMLQDGRLDLKTARVDAMAIINGLRTLKSGGKINTGNNGLSSSATASSSAKTTP